MIKTARRGGFTLIELIVATMISSFIALSLVTIYSTANRHVFQTSRANAVKSDLSVAMKALRNAMGQATLISSPARGSSGTDLVVASNVSLNPDLATSCYPIATGVTPSWQRFCLNFNNSGNYTELLAYSGTINGTGCTCPASCNLNFLPNFACGANSNNKLVLAKFVVNNAAIPPFSRVSGDVLNSDNNSVLVRLRVLWDAQARGFGATQRSVDHTLTSIYSISGGAR